MPFFRMGKTLVHVKLSGRKRHPQPCCARLPAGIRCLAFSSILCDEPLEGGGTCDAPLCEEHATQIGPDRHLCPIHAKQRREKEPELF